MSMVKSEGWEAYLARGESDVGLVVIHEVYGFNDYMKTVASDLASKGYSAAAVDLFRGRRATSLEEGRAIRASLKREDILGCIQAGVNVLKANGVKKFGTIGFCMGGGLALLGACNLSEVSFCVDYYGLIENPEEASGLRGQVLLILASEDERITPWAFANLLPAATKHKKRVEVHLYPNVRHAFHNRSGPSYNEEAAADSWKRTLDFISRVSG